MNGRTGRAESRGTRSWWSASPRLLAKRLFDLAGSLAGATTFSPVLIGASAAIWLTMGRPILFRQIRPGYRGRPFTLYKFRTMREAREGEVWFRSDADRVTAVGRLLRRTSVDELPELWNVLKGDMSLVGPRPLLMEYLPKYTAEEMRRHDVPPGITGWAQVNGRQCIPFSQRLRLDVWYVDHFGLGLDLRILVKTVRDVFRRADVVVGQNVDEVDDIGLSADRQRAPADGGRPKGQE